ncbi:MAG: hypothetical protein ACE5FI_07130, partial [Anaerolineales bacterium]
MSSTNKRPLPPNGKHIPKRPGQWFAIMGASAPGVGLTADDASRSARAERGREPAQVAYLPPTESIESALPPEFAAQRDLLPDELDGKVWLVGGAIRDALLRRPIHDLDFAVDGDALALARRAADTFGGAYYTLDAAREIGRVLIDSPEGRVVLDYARMRGADIVEDLLERDFTINAMGVALPAGSTLLDPAGARDDLQKRMLRATTPHAIARDPLRGVRAVRFAAELGFVIERETRASIRAAAPQLAAVSPERVRDEFMRCLEGPKPAAALRALQLLGLLSTVTPEWDALPGAERETTLALVERLAAVVSVLGARHDIEAASEFALGLVAGRVGRYRVQISRRLHEELSVGRTRRGVFFLGAQLHDAGDAAARAAALRLSTAEGRWLAALVGNWAAAAALVRRGVFLWYLVLGVSG